MLIATQGLSPVAVYIVGTIVGGFILGVLGWVASTLLKHAQIIAVVTLAIPQIQGTLDQHADQISNLRVAQASVDARVTVLGANALASLHRPV